MNELAVFEFGQSKVRTITDEHGEPWFVARDVCDVLELSDTSMAVKGLDDDELSQAKFVSGGQRREMTIISESGLYALIMRSNKPQAKPFRKWVTSEVLPAIRKTGGYAQQRAPLPDLTTPKMAREFRALKGIALAAGLKGNQAVLSADSAMRRLYACSPLQLMQIELKAEDQEPIYTPTELSRLTGRGSAREINRLLAAFGLQEKIDGSWRPTEKGRGLSVLLDTGKRHGGGAMVQQLRWKAPVIAMLGEEGQA